MIKNVHISLIVILLLSCHSKNYQHEASLVPVFDEGLLQSPVNICTKKLKSGVHNVLANYKKSHEIISHLEHTVEVEYDKGSTLTFDETTYECKQFHFHTPSEHLIDGLRFPMEIHFVHTNNEDEEDVTKYFVLSVLFKMGEENVFLKDFVDNIPHKIGTEKDFENRFFTLADLVNEELLDFYHYSGSLTTPPYTETVHWAVSEHIMEASEAQIMKLYNTEGYNARHVQALNGREIELVHQVQKDLIY